MKKIIVKCKNCGKIITIQHHKNDCIWEKEEQSICYECSDKQNKRIGLSLQQFEDDFNQ